MKSDQTAVASSIANPTLGPNPNWFKIAKTELMWRIISGSKAVYDSSIPRIFLVLVRMLSVTIGHLLTM
jgi:hypothetical protein